MTLRGVLFLTLSAATPASSVFVIVPDVISQAGTGAVLAMLAAAVIAVCVAQVYAELASAFPLAGGEYAIVGRVLGPFAGVVVLALNMANSLLVAAVLALGVCDYLGGPTDALARPLTAMAVIGAATCVALLNIRSSALVTGVFMLVELLALLVITLLGALHPVRSLGGLLIHPVSLHDGALIRTPWSDVGLAVAVAIFAYDGYGSAVYFGEELLGARRRIGRTITTALVIIVAAELTPLAAVLSGARDIKSLLASQSPFTAFTASIAGPWISRVLGLGVALAIVNAVVATVLLTARQVYATARDGVWPSAWNARLLTIHPRFHSPWTATLVTGAIAGLLCLVDLKVLLIITGAGAAGIYAVLCVALMAGRQTGSTAASHHRAPLSPLMPSLVVLGLGAVLYADWLDPDAGRPGLLAAAATALGGGLYYLVFLRKGSRFVLSAPADLDNEA
jgi:amino acid transporter